MSINPIVAAAINCAAHGWRVGPLCHRDPSNPRRILHPRGKDPVGYLVPHGVLDFTTDIATVIRWWSRWPWNIGAAVPRAGSSSTSTGPTVGRTPAAGCRPSPSWRTVTVRCRRPSLRSLAAVAWTCCTGARRASS